MGLLSEWIVRMPVITLTTDFGLADGYVGALKGVILSLAPDVQLIDISHQVARQDVRHGARLLATAVPFFPVGTIHVAVVDPGVGTERRGIALQTRYATFVGPDNGLFTPFLQDRVACVALTNPDMHRHPVSATFHGRDIFAPVAAHLASGMSLADLGSAVGDLIALPEPHPHRLSGGQLVAEIVHVDHFGNLVTNVRIQEWEMRDLDDVSVEVQGNSLTLQRAYGNVNPGALLALEGSNGYLEIAVREGSAAERLGIGVGATVYVRGL
jgi:S-adenosylmethionine hydrolase